jgi:hypothetical protein
MVASMTLIVSVVSNLGLVQASDSNVTSPGSSNPSSDPKVFDLRFATGALALAGTYRVGGQRMDTWMPSCIADYSYYTGQGASLGGFAHYLKQRLEHGLTAAEATFPTLVQIVGYVDGRDNASHPELHFIRNVRGISELTGEYEGITPEGTVSEDYWQRDYLTDHGNLPPGGYRSYFNGTPHGRIAFQQFARHFRSYLESIWDRPEWNFRGPETLDELAALVDLQIRTIGTLYQMSDYPAPYIGGEPQVVTIQRPPSAIEI